MSDWHGYFNTGLVERLHQDDDVKEPGDTKITFDMEKGRIKLDGTTLAMLRTIQAQGGVSVTNGQVLRLHLDQKSRFEFIFRGNMLTKIKAPSTTLKVIATDASGNESTKMAIVTVPKNQKKP